MTRAVATLVAISENKKSCSKERTLSNKAAKSACYLVAGTRNHLKLPFQSRTKANATDGATVSTAVAAVVADPSSDEVD